MANIFEQYGIKEVADVTIYKLTKNEDGGYDEIPFLFLDTLKVSTLEQTAESSDARGGKGNAKLLSWDYGKEINVTLEDALYSPASMALMWGGKEAQWDDTTTKITKMLKYDAKEDGSVTTIKDGLGKAWKVIGYFDDKGVFKTSTLTAVKGKVYTVKVETSAAQTNTLTITADSYPGIYKLVGDTYARNRNTGEDEYFQFIIARAKMSAEQTLTLQAEGDPTTFNLNMTVLRPESGSMIELIQYSLPDTEAVDE